jgi:chromate reductase, NAD(P)H dehydrogenase (quinone)
VTDRPIRILGIPGSLRQHSYNRGLIRAAQDVAPEGVEVELYLLHDIPFFNGDVEDIGDPDAVVRFKEAIREADGLLIATPQYNRSIPGVLKNAIDWASRPPRGSALDGKPTAVFGASPGATGTARAQSQLRQAFVFTSTPRCPPRNPGLPRRREVRRNRPPHAREDAGVRREASDGAGGVDAEAGGWLAANRERHDSGVERRGAAP